MYKWILLVVIVIPALEIGLLVLSGNFIGVWPTVGMIILTGVIGAYLAKQQGREALDRVRRTLQSGQMPGDAIIDGLCILVGGILLLTPGFLTDTVGFLLLFPASRQLFKPLLWKWARRWFHPSSRIIIK